MSEDLDPLTTPSPKPLRTATIATMTALIAAFAIVAFAFGGRMYGAGVLIGGVLSFVNFFWLDRSTRAIFEPGADRSVTWVAIKFVARYAFIGLALLGISATGVIPIAAVIVGLAAYAIAIFVQGLLGIFKSSL